MMLKLSSLTLQKINLHTVKEMPVWEDNRDTELKENQQFLLNLVTTYTASRERVQKKCAYCASSEDKQREGSAQNSHFGTPLACACILLACLYLAEIGKNTDNP